MSVVFQKTEKGRNEITERSGGLHPRSRRLLIMVDGKKSVDDIRELVAADDLTHSLGELEELGFIEVLSVREDDGSERPVEGALPSITAFRPLPEVTDKDELDKARHFMINTLRTFCGQYTHMTLMSNINTATTHVELRLFFDDWFRHIVENRQGKRRAEELRGQLLKVI